MMKLIRGVLFLSCVLLASTNLASGQDKQAVDTNRLRQLVKRLEAVKSAGGSEETQRLHRVALLNAYGRLKSSLSDDTRVLKEILAADESGGSVHDQVVQRINKLDAEIKEADAQIQKIHNGSQPTTAATETSSSQESAPAASADRPGTAESSGSGSGSDTIVGIGGTPPAASNLIPGRPHAAAAASSPGSAGSGSANANGSSAPSTQTTVCGQISLASLNEVVTFVNSMAKADLKQGREIDATVAALRTSLQNRLQDVTDDLFQSSLLEECGQDSSRRRGSQRQALIRYLRDGLTLLRSHVAGLTGVANPNVSEELIRKEILLLEGYLGNVKVDLHDKDNNLYRTQMADKDGNYLFENVDSTKGPFTLSTEGDDDFTKRQFATEAGEKKRVNLLIEDRPVSLLARAVVGYQQASAAASTFEQNYFFDLFVSKSLPVKQRIDPDFGERSRAWFAVRSISVPQSGDATIGDLSQNLVANVAGLKAKDAARVFDFLGGVEIRLGSGNVALLPSFDRQTKQKFSASFIAGGGFVTPTDPLDSIKVFKVFNDAPGLPAEAKGKDFVAFVQSDRDRFFRQYYAGFRFQTFYFNRYNVPMQRFPSQFDVTVGQNEYVTGGRLHGPVIRFDAYYPLPFEKLRFINLYSTLVVQPSKVRTTTPLVLEPVTDSSVKVPGPNVALVPVSQFQRDYYKVGVGIDFVTFVQKLMSLSKK